MNWKRLNVNPANRVTQDDAIRALSVLLGKNWKECYIIVANYGLKQGLVMTDKRAVKGVLKKLGYMEQKPSYHCNVEKFIDTMAENGATYMIQVGSSFSAVVNKQLIESFDNRNKTVNSFWYIKRIA